MPIETDRDLGDVISFEPAKLWSTFPSKSRPVLSFSFPVNLHIAKNPTSRGTETCLSSLQETRSSPLFLLQWDGARSASWEGEPTLRERNKLLPNDLGLTSRSISSLPTQMRTRKPSVDRMSSLGLKRWSVPLSSKTSSVDFAPQLGDSPPCLPFAKPLRSFLPDLSRINNTFDIWFYQTCFVYKGPVNSPARTLSHSRRTHGPSSPGPASALPLSLSMRLFATLAGPRLSAVRQRFSDALVQRAPAACVDEGAE